MNDLPVHRSILAVDIEGSTGPHRTNPARGELRQRVYHLLGNALNASGIGPEQCDHLEDRGDGVLALIRPADDVPKTYLLSRFIPELTRLLIGYNAGLLPNERQRNGLRLRAVIHAGEVHLDDNGCYGEAVDIACRLLDAPRLKMRLRNATAPVAVVVSDDIFWGIVKHEYAGIQKDAFQPDVRVLVAGRRRTGWIHLPHAAPKPQGLLLSAAQ